MPAQASPTLVALPAAAPPTGAERSMRRVDRAACALCAGACLGLLGLAAFLSPSPDGHGTHTQVGLPECQWVAAFGRPCPTCGMTTAFAHAADGRVVSAAAAQPLGLLLALGVATVFWGSLHSALTGARVAQAGLGLVNGRTLLGLLGLAVGAWAYKLAAWGG